MGANLVGILWFSDAELTSVYVGGLNDDILHWPRPERFSLPLNNQEVVMLVAITMTNQPVQLHDDGTWEYLVSKESALAKLQAMEQPKESLAFFRGLFDRLGVRIIDSGEEFTCIVHPDKIEFVEGLDPDEVDYCVELFAYQIDIVVKNTAEGYSDPFSKFRVIRVLLNGSPRVQGAAITRLLTSNSLFRKLIDAKDVCHVYLTSPEPEQGSDATYTFLFVKGEWLIARGLLGDPERVLRVSTDDALELQRHLFSGSAKGSLGELRKTATWYKEWRHRVEVPVA